MKRKSVRWLLMAVLVFGIVGCGRQIEEESGSTETAVEKEAVSADAIQTSAASGGAADGTEETSVLHTLSCRLTEQIASGLTQPVIEHMTSELAAQTSEEQLKKSWDGETKGLTGYQGIETVVETVGEERETVMVTIRYKDNKGMKVKYIFNNENRVAGLWFEHTTLPPLSDSGEEKEVKEDLPSCSYEETDFTVGRKPYELNGILTMPSVSGKVPVVILLSGDDAADMDGMIGASENTPMRDLAYGLANRGIATLRYNKRAFQYASTVSSGAGTYELFLQDACYAVDQIYNDRRIDREHIYLLGHGKAADYLTAVIHKKEKRIAGAVMMAGKPVAVREQYYSDSEKDIQFDARYLMDENSTMPLIVLQGEEDFENGLEDFRAWRTVLKGRAHTEYRSFKKLNHYFINYSGKKDATEYDTAGKVNTSVTDVIAAWCLEQD